tara:strand:+ start:554 stop:1192 length:639 start_codon:yes stop_codon:yes gene_type:complete
MVEYYLMIYNLFPTGLGQYNINRNLSKDELEAIHNLKRTNNTGNTISLDKTILNKKTLKNLHQFFQESLDDYSLNVKKPIPSAKYYITSCWANWTSKNQYHHAHTHGNSIFSGVFYVDVEENRDYIQFLKERKEIIDVDMTEDTPWNSNICDMPAHKGDLYIFPSNLEHQVRPIEKEGKERISISFNTFVTGKVIAGDNGTGALNFPQILCN